MQPAMQVTAGAAGSSAQEYAGADAPQSKPVVVRTKSAPSRLDPTAGNRQKQRREETKGGTRRLRKRTTVRRKKIMRKTKKRTYRKKSQKRNNRK